MASLVLGTAGSIIGGMFGGPLGAALGQLAGSALGNMLDPQKVQGPRLTDLKLQTSQYGNMIPIVVGTKRLAGNVIDQTDLVEHQDVSDGKGGPEVTTFSYTVSFMVQLCQVPIVGIPKIWANGRLIHDQVNYNSETSISEYITIYYGTEDQLPDPTFEAHHGAGNVPAYRGTALVVFTDFPVGDYGNAIPPGLEFLVQTVGPENTGLRLVNYDNTGPIEWEWGTTFAGGPFGIGPPNITSWGGGDDGKIVVRNMVLGNGHDYNSVDLTYSGPTNFAGDGSPSSQKDIEGPPDGPSVTWDYFAVGYILINEVRTPVYLYAGHVIANGLTDTVLAAGPVWSDDGVTTETDRNLAVELGLLPGRYIGGIAISQDMRTMIVLTAPTNVYHVDRWHKIVNGELVEEGDIIPTITVNIGLGNWSDAGDAFQMAMLENNGEWWWSYNELTGGGRFKVYNIDPITRIFAENAVAGQLDVSPGPGFPFARPAIYVMQEGFCGVVKASMVAVVSRFPVFDPGGPPLSEVVLDLSQRAGLTAGQVDVTSLEHDIVNGYVISSQTSVRASLNQLQSTYMFDAVESDAKIKFVKRGTQPVIDIPDDDLAAHEFGSEPPDLMQTTRQQEVELPRRLFVNYSDSETDYQTGTQYAERQVVESELEATLALAVVLTPSEAKSVAETNIYNAWMERERFSLWLSRKYAFLEPTDVITARGRTIRLTEEVHQPVGILEFKGVPSHSQIWISAPAGTSGSGFSQTLPSVKQETEMAILDIPLVDGSADSPGFNVAVSGRLSSRWKGAAIYRSRDGGVNYTRIGSHVQPNSMGKTTTVLGDFAGGNVFDEGNSVTVLLSRGSPDLVSKTRTQILNGENLCVIGNELAQFKTVTVIGPHEFELSGWLRGRYGTEWAMGSHAEIDPFVLLPAYDHAEDSSDIGTARHYKGVTLGMNLSTATAHPFTSRVVRLQPLSPVLLGGGTDAAGNVTLQWTRRTRIRGRWLNIPLAQTSEVYVVQIWNAARTLVARIVTGLNAPTFEYTAAMQVTDFGATQETVYFSVGQVGSYGLSVQGLGTAPGTGGSDTAPLVPVAPYPSFNAPPTPPTVGTPDENRWIIWKDLYDAGGRDRQLAYHYTRLNASTISWYQRMHVSLLIPYIGSPYGWAVWVQDGDLSPPPSTVEMGTLRALDLTAG